MATFHKLRQIFIIQIYCIFIVHLRKRSAIIFLNMLQLITTDITLNTSNRILNAPIKRVKKKTFFFSSLPIHQLNRIVCSAADFIVDVLDSERRKTVVGIEWIRCVIQIHQMPRLWISFAWIDWERASERANENY